MKCKNCGTHLEPGTLFCPKCLTEINWVPEYTTMETMLNEKKRNQEKQKKASPVEEPKKPPTSNRPDKRKNGRKKRSSFVYGIIMAVIILATAIFMGYSFWNYNSYQYQYDKAQQYYDEIEQNGNYEKALDSVQRATEIAPEEVDAHILLAKIQVYNGGSADGIKILTGLLDDFPDSVEVYRELITLYEDEGQVQEIKDLLDGTNSAIISKEFSDYITENPIVDTASGTYSTELKITIQADDASVYYTLDGTEPTNQSNVYSGTLLVEEGTTTLKTIAYNQKGIPSDVITRKYVVSIETPNPPVITPDAGTYTEATYITIEVPEGYTAYYAFNEIPTTNSTPYTTSILMPSGSNTFYAIIESESGKTSEAASKYYYYRE
ncbi:MAG: chitobiase/beta-hexosaminidase C-terminal domain-containing protein [Lachnospiraceae bacterium]